MNRLILVISLLAVVAIAKGQDGFTHVFGRGGFANRQASQLSLGFDFAAKYHNAYELAFTYYRAKSSYENLLLGANYKPVILRNKNSNLRFRFGGYFGTDLNKFVVSPNAGLEWVQSLASNIDLIVANNNGYYFGAEKKQRWRIAAEIGIRLPL